MATTKPRINMRKDVSINDILSWYEHDFYCANCRAHNWRYVRKGVKVKGLSVKCDNCGCRVSG